MTDDKLQAVLGTLAVDTERWSDFIALCDCGGRQAGSVSEARALAVAEKSLRRIGPTVRVERIPYAGWRKTAAALTLADGTALACNPLIGSESTPPEGLSAEICDLGRGAPEDFERHASDIGGRLVLVRHEYPFSPQHIHRRRKLGWAMEHGAAGFIIANPHPGAGAVAGSSGRGGGAGIPAAGTDFESARLLCANAKIGDRPPFRSSRQRNSGLSPIFLKLIGEDYSAETSVLTLDFPGRTPQWVALSAHLDGHDLAESAMDNATGVVTALSVARAIAPHAAQCQRGLRVCLFSAEEWALAGSKQYLDSMSEDERRKISLNVNLDTVGGDSRLTALTSEFPRLDTFVRDLSAREGLELQTYQPMMANSDHYNFARHRIPALRLVAGFDRPESNIRYILTRGDTRDTVQRSELQNAARVAATLVWAGLTMSDEEIGALRGAALA